MWIGDRLRQQLLSFVWHSSTSSLEHNLMVSGIHSIFPERECRFVYCVPSNGVVSRQHKTFSPYPRNEEFHLRPYQAKWCCESSLDSISHNGDCSSHSPSPWCQDWAYIGNAPQRRTVAHPRKSWPRKSIEKRVWCPQSSWAEIFRTDGQAQTMAFRIWRLLRHLRVGSSTRQSFFLFVQQTAAGEPENSLCPPDITY